MKDAHCKEETDDFEEVFIVLFSNAVVKPPAMMIETAYASVTLPTMLCVVLHMRFAYLTIELEV